MGERATAQVDYKATGLQTLSQAGNLITGINQGLQLMRTGFTALTAVTKTFIATGSQFERYEVQFTTLLGSIEAARDRMKELTTFAMETPFDLPGVVEAAQKLEAYGVYAEKTLRTVGDAAAAMGKTLEQGVEAIADASRGELERLKEFGISAAELTERMGHQLNRATVEGLEEIKDTVLAIMGERYGGGMMALSETLGGSISNLRGYWIEFKKEVADAEAFQTVKDIFGVILDTVRQLFDQGEAQRFASTVGETIARAMIDATIEMARAAKGVWQAADAVIALVKVVDPAAKVSWLGKRWQEAMAFGRPGGVTGGRGPRGEAILGLPRYEEAGYVPPAQAVNRYQRIDDVIAALITSRAGIGMGPDYGPPLAGGGPAEWKTAPAGPAYGPAMEEMGAGYFFTGEYGPQAGQAGPSDEAFARMEKQQKMIGVLTQSWESHYARISQAAFKWGQGEGRIIKDIYRMTKMSLVASLQDVVHYMTKKAAMKQIEAAAEALMAGGWGNIFSAGKFIGAAALWSTLGGAAGGIIGGFATEREPDFGTVGEGAAGAPPDSRTISRGVGIKAQNITINIHVGHYGATVYGDGGIRQLWEEHLEPLIEQSFAMGRV